MKDISQLSKDLDKVGKKLIENLMGAQRETADDVLSELKNTANIDKGGFRESIYKTDTTLTNGVIETYFGSNAWVISSTGKRYNLGCLLETGTSPHLIEPVYANVLHFKINGEDIFAKRVQHPGTMAYNNFKNAIDNNRFIYQDRIREAVRKAMK